VILVSGRAHAADPDETILGRDPGWRIEEVRARASWFEQRGRGFQSQDGPIAGPGDESMWIFQPIVSMRIRQNDHVVHDVTVPVDIVSAASPDAVDSVSSASRVNEAGGVDVRTAIRTSDVTTVLTRVGFHIEEPLSAGFVGGGVVRSLADGNAGVSVTGNFMIDGFDGRNQRGEYLGKRARMTANANVAFSQILTPTTVADASYGVTFQAGTLEQGWNSVPVAGLGMAVAGEKLPDTRLRHAIAGRLAQHVPWTRTTLRAGYRYYRDDFGLRAHTIDVQAYQWIGPRVYVHGTFRFHRQTGVSFFTTSLAAEPTPTMDGPRTADSDLAPFDADDYGLELVYLGAHTLVSGGYVRYVRTNDLTIDVFSIEYGRRF
jgi:hypothetical protein